jgi:large subunit ribosomal protein L19
MSDKTSLIQEQLKQNLPEIKPGDLVRVHQKIKEKNKERIQIFEGRVIARKHGKGINATITVRKVISNVGVEKIFPIHSPNIEKIEIAQKSKVKRAKLYYLRDVSPKKARLKKIEFKEAVAVEPEPEQLPEQEKTEPVEEKPAEEKKE